MDIKELAIKVADALENPDTWCQHSPAQDARGNPRLSLSPDAVRWCAIGHARRIAEEFGCYYADPPRLRDTYSRRFGESVETDNDCQGREFVRDRLRQLAKELP